MKLQAIAAEPIFTMGPIQIELVAIENGETQTIQNAAANLEALSLVAYAAAVLLR
ncbi:MAG: hypothetical protein QNJ46_28605 [Leptolyngbyaceae cyanobacterium MO_188.B28]|nr:hypothetical protein [Leptolyngbyaceae cyanobacterium MO_188.B28]